MMDGAVKEKLLAYLPAIEGHWDEVSPLVRVRRVPVKTTLLRDGEISDNLFIVIEGCLRLFFVKNDGSEYTSQFFFEGQLVTSLESFATRTPSRQYLETLEPSTVCAISAKNVETILGLHEDFRKWYFSYLKDRLIYYTRAHSSFILDSPEERYLRLVKEYPFILQRVSQHYIASYLGVTPVSLSRIRARIKNRKLNKG